MMAASPTRPLLLLVLVLALSAAVQAFLPAGAAVRSSRYGLCARRLPSVSRSPDKRSTLVDGWVARLNAWSWIIHWTDDDATTDCGDSCRGRRLNMVGEGSTNVKPLAVRDGWVDLL
jgi:hypothetical protein